MGDFKMVTKNILDFLEERLIHFQPLQTSDLLVLGLRSPVCFHCRCNYMCNCTILPSICEFARGCCMLWREFAERKQVPKNQFKCIQGKPHRIEFYMQPPRRIVVNGYNVRFRHLALHLTLTLQL